MEYREAHLSQDILTYSQMALPAALDDLGERLGHIVSPVPSACQQRLYARVRTVPQRVQANALHNATDVGKVGRKEGDCSSVRLVASGEKKIKRMVEIVLAV